MGPNLSNFIEQLQPFLSQEIETMDWGREPSSLVYGPHGHQTITATFPKQGSLYYQIIWYYEVEADRMFQFSLVNDDGIYIIALGAPINYLDHLLTERSFYARDSITYKIRIDESPYLQLGRPCSVAVAYERDETLLNLALAAFHGEDVGDYFLDRVLEMGGTFGETIHRSIISNR